MKNCFWGLQHWCSSQSARHGPADIEYKPIDTGQVPCPADQGDCGLVGRSINAIGQTASNRIKSNGYVKTINNLFSKKIYVPHTQTGPSALPAPTMFRSTRYKNYNTPVMPISQPRR